MEEKIDRRKNNGNKGHSTKSKSKIDRRKTGSFQEQETVDLFLNDIKEQLLDFYKGVFRTKVKETISGGFYVYAHLINEEVVYVGKGSNDRMYQKNRTVLEHNLNIENGLISYKILSSGMSNDIALITERALIDFYSPIYNTINDY